MTGVLARGGKGGGEGLSEVLVEDAGGAVKGLLGLVVWLPLQPVGDGSQHLLEVGDAAGVWGLGEAEGAGGVVVDVDVDGVGK